MYLTKNSLKRNPSKKYWTKHVYHNFSEEKSVQSNFREKPSQKKWQIHQKYLMRHLYQKTVEGKIMSTSTQIYLKKSSPPNYLRRKLSTKQTLHKSLFQTNSKRNLYQRILEETCLPNIVRRQLSMKNKMNKYIPINLFKQFLYQNFSKKTRKLWRDILQSKKIHLYQKVPLETSAYQTKYAEKSPRKKYLKKNLFQRNEQISPPKKLKQS